MFMCCPLKRFICIFHCEVFRCPRAFHEVAISSIVCSSDEMSGCEVAWSNVEKTRNYNCFFFAVLMLDAASSG